MFVVFDSNQIKSADPVTYDDAGNVIPLSERFKETEDDIRFSAGVPTAASSAQEAYERAVLDRWNRVRYEFQDRRQHLIRLKPANTA